MGLEVVVLVLSVVILGVQLFAWRWARRLTRDLRGLPGYEMAALMAWVIGGITVARLLGLVWALAAGWTKIGIDDALLLTTVTQGMVALVLLRAVWQVRRMSGETPVDGASETVPQRDTEPAGKVPLASSHVGTPVDNGHA